MIFQVSLEIRKAWIMGMTIDKCLWELRTMRAGIKCGLQYEETDEDKEIDREQIEALQMAISTMRKYQKIEELYDYWRSGKCEYTISCMENIGKVLRDGNEVENDN